MATILKSDKDATRYVLKLVKKYPDGILVTGPSGSGKSTLAKAILQNSDAKPISWDRFGHEVDGEWHIKWDELPDDWDIIEGVSNNLHELDDAWDTSEMAVLILQPNPVMWIEAMAARGAHEDHAFVEEFQRIGALSPTAAKKEIRSQMVGIREAMKPFGDRIFGAQLSPWPGYKTEKGRTVNE